MAPPSKYSADQLGFIQLWMPEFLLKKAGKRLDQFWPRMNKAWLKDWPVELEIGLPLQEVDANAGPPPELTEQQRDALNVGLETRFKQLRNSFFNAYAKIRSQRGGVGKSALSLAALLFKARPKGRRRHQVLEVFQKLYPEKVRAALRLSEYDSLNEAALCRNDEGEWIDDEDDETKMKRVSSTRSKRMRVWRRVAQEVWEAEPEPVKEKVREMARKEPAVVATPDENEDGAPVERTPEEYQLSIDESIQVAEMFLGEFQKMTGWMGVLVYGGPMPNHNGELAVKAVSFGKTADGLTFETHHRNWKKNVSNALFKFLREAIPTEVRLKRALYSGEEEEEEEEEAAVAGSAGNDEPTPTPTATSTPTAAKSKKTKTKAKSSDAELSATKPARRPQKKKKATGVAVAAVAAVAEPVFAMPQENQALDAGPIFDGDNNSYQMQHMFEEEDPNLSDTQYLSSETTFSQSHDTSTSQGLSNSISHELSPTTTLYSPGSFSQSSHFSQAQADDFAMALDLPEASHYFENDGSSSLSNHSSSGSHGWPDWSEPAPRRDTPAFNFPPSFVSGTLGSFGPGTSPLEDDLVLQQEAVVLNLAAEHPRPKPRLRDPSLPGPAPFAFGRQPQYRRPYELVGSPSGTPIPPSTPSMSRPLTSIPPSTPTDTPPPSSSIPPSTPTSTPRPSIRPSTPTSTPPSSTPIPSSTPPSTLPPLTSIRPSTPSSRGIATPKRLSSAPARSSPLAGPPLQAPATPLRSSSPQASESLPPRLRSSPVRQASSTAPRPRTQPIYPQSRPMANPPKMRTAKPTSADFAERMKNARAAKATAKKKGKTVKGKEKAHAEGRAGTEAQVGASTELQAGASTESQAHAGTETGAEAAAPAAPLLIFSSTNNNGARLRREDAARRAAAKRLHNPDGPTPLAIFRPRRAITTSVKLGAPTTVAQRNAAKSKALEEKSKAEDEAILKALRGGNKRKASENLVPAHKKQGPGQPEVQCFGLGRNYRIGLDLREIFYSSWSEGESLGWGTTGDKRVWGEAKVHSSGTFKAGGQRLRGKTRKNGKAAGGGQRGRAGTRGKHQTRGQVPRIVPCCCGGAGGGTSGARAAGVRGTGKQLVLDDQGSQERGDSAKERGGCAASSCAAALVLERYEQGAGSRGAGNGKAAGAGRLGRAGMRGQRQTRGGTAPHRPVLQRWCWSGTSRARAAGVRGTAKRPVRADQGAQGCRGSAKRKGELRHIDLGRSTGAGAVGAGRGCRARRRVKWPGRGSQRAHGRDGRSNRRKSIGLSSCGSMEA
ncbi:hypothetical protein B0H17DRAFT_1148721 [Mycena rosella]|uniref:Uncharacterized protein n=1 Tax=Mycena rosella TaxID=1033263 RepID=A0AAD7FXK7_MYCRO|nr:hypothetical protein B0H17DRAFT_1148721 [Mycena rosella]